MSELHRAALAFGVAATLLAATSAFAIDAAKPDAVPEVSADTQQAVALVSGGVAAKPSGDPSCPSVSVAPDGADRRADGARTTLDGLARDCANLGAETIVKVALVGEGERKRAKEPTAFDAPMTIQVRDAEGRDVETRRISVKVEMPEGVQKVAFRHVEENVSLPPPSADGYANWTIIVGFDPTQQDVGDVAAAEEEQADPEPSVRSRARSTRSARSKRYRSVRATVVGRANTVARRRIVLQPPQATPADQPVRVTTTTIPRQPIPAPVASPATAPRALVAAPPAAPRAPVTSGSALAKAAASFTERRDRDLEARRNVQQPVGRQRPPAAQPQAANRGRAPQPQAARQQPQTVRTAQNEN